MTQPGDATVHLPGLETETVYHYRFRATNGNGTSNGPDRTFTPHWVAGLETGDATDIGPGTATLHGELNPSGESTHYYFEWGETKSYGHQSPAVPGTETSAGALTQVEMSLAGLLTSATTYHYRLVAVNGLGTSYGSDREFTTPLSDSPQIRNVAATATGLTTATLHAELNPGFGDTAYKFQYGPGLSYGTSTAIIGPIGNDGSFHPVAADISGLSPGTTYHFRVIAFNFVGHVSSSDAVFTTPTVPAIGEAAASVLNSHSVRLSARAGAPGTSTTIHFEYGVSAGYGAQSVGVPVGSDGPGSVIVTGLSPSTTYHFRAVAANEFGQAAGARPGVHDAGGAGHASEQKVQAGLRPEQGQVREEAPAAQAQRKARTPMKIRDDISCSLLLVGVAAAMPTGAGAETTHKFLKSISLPGQRGASHGGRSPGQHHPARRRGGAEVQPSGRTRELLGAGHERHRRRRRGQLPATPSDCDETPWNSLGPATVAAMNQSTTGPTAGYMYVAAVKEVEPGVTHAQIVVFDPTGAYRGQIDTTQPTPLQSPEGVPTYLSVSPSGSSIIVTYNERRRRPYHADKYQAVDADPAHDPFVGQIRKGTYFANKLAAGGFALGTVADDEVVYVGRGNFYNPAASTRSGSSTTARRSRDRPATHLRWTSTRTTANATRRGRGTLGGRHEEGYGYVESASINPADHHVFLLDGPKRESARRVGDPDRKSRPRIREPGNDRLRERADGLRHLGHRQHRRAHLRQQGQLDSRSSARRCRSPTSKTCRHPSGTTTRPISATIDLDHGPKVSDCRVE